MAGKILIVDDEKKITDLISFRLEYKGFEVAVANSGQEALDSIKKEKPVLVILDIIMPDMTGYQVCEKIKANKATQSIKVLLLTAKGQKQDEEEGYEAGADDYMTKPFRANLLVEKIDMLLNN